MVKKQLKDNIFSIIIYRWEKEVSSSLESYENSPSKEKYASATLTALSVYMYNCNFLYVGKLLI